MRFFVAAALVQLLLACSSVGGDALTIINAARQSTSSSSTLPDFSSGLDPKYRYLWVQAGDDRAAVLALGFEEVTPKGTLETWYATGGGFIQTLNGRLASSQGLQSQWAAVKWIGQPGLGDQIASDVRRFRDVLPSYVFGVEDQLHTESMPFAQVPPSVLPEFGPSGFWSKYRWFKERVVTTPGTMSVQDSWFATGSHRAQSRTIVASYQCMDQHYCLKTARWPLEPEKN